MGKDRRRHPRAEVQLDVTLDAAGRESRGNTVKRLVDAFKKHEWQEVLNELGVGPLPDEGLAPSDQSVVPLEGESKGRPRPR